MAQVFPYDRAAVILSEAAFFGDTPTIKKHGITRRTLQNYRARLSQDPKLAQIFASKKSFLTREWAADLAPAIRGCIDFIRRAQEKADPSDPETIKAINGSLKILSDVAQAERVLDARLSSATRPPATEHREVVSGDGEPLATH